MNNKEWGTFGKFAAVTGALFLIDKPVQQAALKLRNQMTAVNDISHVVTNFGSIYGGFTLVALGGYGLIVKNKKLLNTSLLASQSCITGGAVAYVLKFLTGETRPSYYAPDEVASPRFLGPFANSKRGNETSSSFPSGHTTVAFAAATIFALEYKDRPFIPVLAYSAASLVGISRITENVHWATDVAAGAALGYITGKLIEHNYHRFVKKNTSAQAGNVFSFRLQYNYNHWEPGLVCRFR